MQKLHTNRKHAIVSANNCEPWRWREGDLYQHYQHQLSKSGGRQFKIRVLESRRWDRDAEIEGLDQEDVWSRKIFRKILIKTFN